MNPFQVPANQVLSTLDKHMLVDGFHIIIDLEKSHGNYIVDANSSKEYLDMYSFFASLPIGHNHPKLVQDEEFTQALLRAALTNPTNSDIYTQEFAYFVDKFSELVKPKHFKHMFFIAGGGLAVENALKASFDWKVQKNFKKGYKEEKGHQVIHFREAFHGRTGYTMSLTNTDEIKIMYFPKFKWPRITNPKLSFPATEKIIANVIQEEERAYAEIRKACEENKDDIAAMIIEPIQGEGGDNHFRPEFFQGLRKLADELDFMLIFDEVQTGGGVTGTFWCCEQFGMMPDMIAFGKKTQVCGIMVSDRIDEVEKNVFEFSGRINSTWGGNLVDMIRGLQYAKIIKEDKLEENAAKVGKLLQDELVKLSQKYPQIITNVRGRGLFIAFDLADTKTRNEIRTRCFDKGLATLPCGTHSIRFRPCLTLTEAEALLAVNILESAL